MDETSNTLAVGERIQLDLNKDLTIQPFPEYIGAVRVGVAPDTRVAGGVDQLKPYPSGFAVNGESINGESINGESINSFAGPHPGGVHFLFLVDSVRFISKNSDQTFIS